MRNIPAIVFLVFFITAVSYSPFFAQDMQTEIEELTLYVGESKILPIDNPTRVVVSHPNVADVISVSTNQLLIEGKGAGVTSIVWWDNLGEHSVKLNVFSENMNLIKQRADDILTALGYPNVYTRAADSEGKILLLGNIKGAQDKEKILKALETLKNKIVDLLELKEEEAIVDIAVQVLEITEDATKTLGFTFPGGVSLTEPTGRFKNTFRGTLDAFFHILDWQRADFTATYDFLVQEGKVKILSHPRIACQSGKEAELWVGGEKPTFSTQVVSGGTGSFEGTTVAYKEYGIKLKIKPKVTEEKQIKLALNIEVSEVQAPETIGSATSPTAKAYPLTKRNVSTELILGNGQTMAIGGLIKQKSEEDIRKNAFLGDIPIIGMLFRKKTTKAGGGQGERGDTELFITLTPKIIGQEIKTEKLAKIEEAPEIKRAPSLTKEVAPLTINKYTEIVSQRIQENISYPWAAKQGQLKGTLILNLCLSSAGDLLDAKIKQSSGLSVLDENALTAVKKISPFPPFPPAIREKVLCIEIPIVYSLQ